MKKTNILSLFTLLIFSLACQTLFPEPAPPRDGTVILSCANTLKAIRELQPIDLPQGLNETGIKQGDEFDVNEYFSVLPNLSMTDGYTLDYVFYGDSLGGFPVLAARPADLPPYGTRADIPDPDLEKYWKYLEVKDTEQGYFDFVAFTSAAAQFYLVWHANYYDSEIVCDQNAVDVIVAERQTGRSGMEFDNDQMRQIETMNNIEPLVKLTDTTVTVEIVTFTKWGGFFRKTYTISRAFPHEIMDVQGENIVPYDCGILF
ncbi:MAG: hypothetical protein IT309_00535 [Anaerolineales bacterium]|nr:hypothetical protein [Chloroflexota bacterium]MCC6984889.1 hypothetical protein [Anaerolineales bacterium]